jgi:hypothetical protein
MNMMMWLQAGAMSLLYKPLESVDASDLQALIDNQTSESLHLEYKSEVFDKRDEKKRLQFLGSVSAFANAAGGDILIGVRADNGLPVDLPGLDPVEIDSEVLRIRQVVGTSIEPHVGLHFHAVPLPSGRRVLVIRIPRSWTAPHGIEQKGHFHFFQRHAAGRSPMTISELRAAFTFSGSIIEHTKRFRAERLATITAAEGTWGYLDQPLCVFHAVPFAGMADAVHIDFSATQNLRRLSPLPAEQDGFIREGDVRYNLDGVVMRQGIEWHTQLFRNGCIEYATTAFFEQRNSPHYLDAWQYQVNVVRVLARFCALQHALGVAPPVTLLLSILNAANFHLRTSEGWPVHGAAVTIHQIDSNQIFLPELVLNNFGADLVAALKPVFDCLWNAAGEKQCGFYRFNGAWNIEPSWLDPPSTY